MRSGYQEGLESEGYKKETRQGVVGLYRVSGIHYKREKKADA
ncbi:hypothetical protein C8R21_11523 [Nitrosospira multiformis]|jgi:hypothetical protein|uniref:Uncharacterized protein n=1 Tax=Nitrosospira multiformis TaxID=1231 RepID=A0A2T5I9M2_9PROT|nr:hypothetical protein [Nitrosospira multiformis]PTQ80526.1 hypothetical protein C8R21_11523 [Nitrosospira multiformis]